MVLFPCTTCAQPRTLASSAWIYDAPFCSETCARVARASGRFEAPPAAATVLASAADAIVAASRLVEDTARAAARADRAAASGAASAAAWAWTLPIARALEETKTSEAVALARREHEAAAVALEQRLREVARQLMALHALGYPIASQLERLVTSDASARGTHVEFEALFQFLANLGRGIRVWIRET